MPDDPPSSDPALDELAEEFDAQHEKKLRRTAQLRSMEMMDVLHELAIGETLDEDGKVVAVETSPTVRRASARDVIDYGLPRGNLAQQELQAALAEGIQVALIHYHRDGTESEPEVIDIEPIDDAEIVLPDSVGTVEEILIELEIPVEELE